MRAEHFIKHKLLGKALGMIILDVPRELEWSRSVYCLPIRRDPYWTAADHDTYYSHGTNGKDELERLNLLMGLALQHAGKHRYRRVGLLSLARKDWFAGSVKQEVQIV